MQTLRRPPSGWKNEDTKKRIDFIKQKSGLDYSTMLTEEASNLRGVIEQHIGYQTIPMAAASPLVLEGDYAKGSFIVPVCTVEGTLVYSLTRGMMATSELGIQAHHTGQRVNRAPMFMLNDISDITPFYDFIKQHYQEIKKAAESTTRYGTLLDIKPLTIHKSVVLDMIFSTGNAAGQNMVTIAARESCEYISKNFPIKNYFLESGFNCDKKASRRTMSAGRGHSVVTQAHISKKVLNLLLGVNADEIQEFTRSAIAVSHFTGVLGSQLHLANALTAVYMATGQDVGCVCRKFCWKFRLSRTFRW